MNITADLGDQIPVPSFLVSENSRNEEMFRGLLQLIGTQKLDLSVPRTPESLFLWFGMENSLYILIQNWFTCQLPQMDETMIKEFVALALELTAHRPDVHGSFYDLHNLQQREAYATCHKCSSSRPFLLPSSMGLHNSVHHNCDIPLTCPVTAEKIETAVWEIFLAHKSQCQPSPAKRGRTRLTTDQLAILRSNFDLDASPSDDTVTSICAKTGLKEKVVKHWFRNTLFKERQRSKENPSNFSFSSTDVNPDVEECEKSGWVIEVQQTEASARSTTRPPTKRIRTAISQNQQALLAGYFQVDQNPSRRQMDAISSKVGLPKRVVQVWFQNARSRERKLGPVTSSSASRYPSCQQQQQQMNPTLEAPVVPLPYIVPPRESSTQPPSLGHYDCHVSGPNASNAFSESSPISSDLLKQFIMQLLQNQIPPLGAPPPPLPFEVDELDSPLDLTTGSSRSNDQESPHSENHSPVTSSVATEARPENFCRRNRTSISLSQARFMQSFFMHHKTPTICECENIGRAIGLSRRVVQVWFQNQRAKEKKIARTTAVCGEGVAHQQSLESLPLVEAVKGSECKLCNSMISSSGAEEGTALIEHIFSKTHMDRLLMEICQMERWSLPTEKRTLGSSQAQQQ
ncbi:unnamed protein product [Mesocestoides corti]|nr:unnamed protein product [Mesocestoides corti]